jgi:hypothetical protein
MATKKKPGAKRGGRQPVPIERHAQRFEIACIRAFLGFGLGPFDATRRALLVVKGGPISMADIEGVLRLSQAAIPLPEAADEPNAAERRLFAKAARREPEPWLLESSAVCAPSRRAKRLPHGRQLNPIAGADRIEQAGAPPRSTYTWT